MQLRLFSVANTLIVFAFKTPLILTIYGQFRVFVWGRRPDVSSGRFLFHVRYFDFNIWGTFYYFVIICFYLSISWIYWLEDNRILQLNSSKLPHHSFSLLIEWNISEVTISFSFLLGQGERKIPRRTHYTCWLNKKRAKEFCRLLQNMAHLCLILKTFLRVNGI